MSDRQGMIDELREKISYYNPDADIDLIIKAFNFAYDKHKGQKRNSGEDYIIHPFHVALILAELRMDTPTLIGGLLHDVVEDTDATISDVEEMFGEDVANIVDGVTKLTKINYKSKEEKQAENIRKMVLAMANDIRVIIVKLADRLHNMRTLEYMTEEKKIEKATEVIEIYGPLAGRLGISKLKWELEDLALRYLDEDGYYDLAERVSKRRSEREDIINKLIDDLYRELKEVNIEASISGRPKSLYSIYKKMHVKGKSFDEIYDLSAVRIIVDEEKDCYGALGVVHSHYKPIPGRFKDYIAMPKSNMYQSLHTTVIDDAGEIFEVQIRTKKMHEIAEYGIAAHWKYKEAGASVKNLKKGENLNWVGQMIEWQQEQSDPTEFMEGLKVDFFTDEVFVFTPKGDVISMAEGSTPIDFAYNIHTQVGHRCVGAKVNGKIVPLDYKLRNGNIVEIITDKNSGPSMDWLNIVISSKAKNKIRQYFKEADKEKNILLGKELLENELKKLNYNPKSVLKENWLSAIAEKYRIKSIDDLYANIGHGGINTSQVVHKLIDFYQSTYKVSDEEILSANKKLQKNKKKNDLGITIQGESSFKMKLAGCCNPVPGDNIIGYVTRGRGVTIHRADCMNIANVQDQNRLLQAEWDIGDRSSYNAELCIKAISNKGLLANITNKVADSNISINSLDAKTSKDRITTIDIVLEIRDIDELNKLIGRFKNIDNVIDVYRVTG